MASGAQMIGYIAVTNSKCVLAEYDDTGRGLGEAIRRMLPTIEEQAFRTSMKMPSLPPYSLHVLPEAVSEGSRLGAGATAGGSREAAAASIRYVCLAHRDYQTVLPMQTLESVAGQFRSTFDLVAAGSAGEDEAATAYGSRFRSTLQATLLRFTDPARDTMTKVRGHIDRAKGSLAESIEAAVERGGRLDALAEDSRRLQASSSSFAGGSRRIAREAAWRVTRGRLALAGAVLLLLLVVGMLGCGPGMCVSTLKGSAR